MLTAKLTDHINLDGLENKTILQSGTPLLYFNIETNKRKYKCSAINRPDRFKDEQEQMLTQAKAFAYIKREVLIIGSVVKTANMQFKNGSFSNG